VALKFARLMQHTREAKRQTNHHESLDPIRRVRRTDRHVVPVAPRSRGVSDVGTLTSSSTR
jgi:hypothetical protein